jgi:hypothetical protein
LFFIYKSYTSITNYVEIKTPYNRIIYSIEKDQIFTVYGHIGKLTIEIKDKKVRVKESSCPNQVCVKTGWINKSGEIIVCAPNEVTFRILSFKNSFFP